MFPEVLSVTLIEDDIRKAAEIQRSQIWRSRSTSCPIAQAFRREHPEFDKYQVKVHPFDITIFTYGDIEYMGDMVIYSFKDDRATNFIYEVDKDKENSNFPLPINPTFSFRRVI